MSLDVVPDPAKQIDFHIKELEGLRAEISFYTHEIRWLERAAVIGPVTVYSWLAVQERLENSLTGLFAWWLPFILICFIWLRRRHAERSILRIASYLRKVEDHFALRTLGGWENYVEGLRSNPTTRWRKFSRTFWICIFVVCLLVPALVTFERSIGPFR